MPIFRRKPKPPPAISIELPSGEEVERTVAAELLRGKSVLRGVLFLTNRRLMFEAQRGDARWMIVPYDEVQSAALYPAPNPHLGGPPSRKSIPTSHDDRSGEAPSTTRGLVRRTRLLAM